MESVHKQFSFTSCHASKKKKNEWVQQKKWGFLMPLDEWIKTFQALSDLHCENKKCKNVKIIALPIRDTNDSNSHCKSQYIHGTQ